MIKIKSVSDVITNSSSETFLIKSYLCSSKIKEDLKGHDYCHLSSGMGGIIEVLSNGETSNFGFYNTPEFLPEGYLLVEIDQAKKELIKYLLSNYNVVDVEDSNILVNSDGRVLDYTYFSNKKPGYIEGNKILGIIYDYEEYKDETMSDEYIEYLKAVYKAHEHKNFPTFKSYKIHMKEKIKKVVEDYKKLFGGDEERKVKVKVKSISDVITNSSSETFLIKSYLHSSEIKKDLEKHNNRNESSGVGGIIKIVDEKTNIKLDLYNIYLPENYFILEIDKSKINLIRYLLKNYRVVDMLGCPVKIDSTGRVVDYINNDSSDIVDESDFEYGILIRSLQDYRNIGLFKWSCKFLRRLYKHHKELRDCFKNFESYKNYIIKWQNNSIENYKNLFENDKDKKY